MRTIGRTVAQGALVGALAMGIIGVLTSLGSALSQDGSAIRLVLAFAAAGFYGALAGAALGLPVGIVRAVRTRQQQSAMVSAGPYSYVPKVRPQGGGHPQTQVGGSTAAVPLAPISVAPERTASERVDLSDPDRLNRVLARLDALPGLEAVAEQVRSMARRIEQDQRRRAAGLKVAETGLHAIFMGPSGTGKTTVAQVWGEVLCATGLLPTDKVVEVDRSNLVGETVGSTGPRTLAKVAEAMGGVLFIDEAYSLTPPTPGNDFGGEAIAALLRAMESRRGKFAVICAGYEEEMQRFLRSNSGLRSRFSRTVNFPHYDAAALLRVADTMAEQSEYVWAEGARRVLQTALIRLTAAPPEGWANAREVRDLLDAAIDAQSDRIGGDDGDLSTLTEDDVRAALAARYPQVF